MSSMAEANSLHKSLFPSIILPLMGFVHTEKQYQAALSTFVAQTYFAKKSNPLSFCNVSCHVIICHAVNVT